MAWFKWGSDYSLIFTLYSSAMLLLSFTCIVLGVYVFEPAIHFYRSISFDDLEVRYMLEKEFYLASTVALLIMLIRVFTVPLFFWTMQVLIPMIPGAMCIWGVFNAQPLLCWASLFLKLLLPAAYVGWLILLKVNSGCHKNPLMKTLMGLFVILFPLLIVDCVVDVLTFLNLTPVNVVCCTSGIDAWPRVAESMFPGGGGQLFLLAGFFGVCLLFSGLVYYSAKKRVFTFYALSLTPLLVWVTVTATSEVFTPLILRAPIHFCPFCLFYHTPVSVLFAVSLWLGVSCLWWSVIVDGFGRGDDESKNLVIDYVNKLKVFSSSFIASGLIILSLQLLLTLMI